MPDTAPDTRITESAPPRILIQLQSQSVQDKIRALVPPTMTYERFNRLAVSLVHRNPKLAECDPVSFFACLSDCATIGVYPDPVTGLAYFIPRWSKKKNCNEVTLLVGYKGLRSIALRSSEILDLWTGIVRQGDTFKIVRAPRQELLHEIDPSESGEIIGYYSIAALKSGLTSFEWMTRSAIEKVKHQVLEKLEEWQVKDSPWTLWEEEMARKTALRRHFKSLPLRPEDQEAAARELAEEDRHLKNVTGTGNEDGANGAPLTEAEQKAAAIKQERPVRKSGVKSVTPEQPDPEQKAQPADATLASPKRAEKTADKAPDKPADPQGEQHAKEAAAQAAAVMAVREAPKLFTFADLKFPCTLTGSILKSNPKGKTAAGKPLCPVEFKADGMEASFKCFCEAVALPLLVATPDRKISADFEARPQKDTSKPPVVMISGLKAEVEDSLPEMEGSAT